jgi:hypothetical protein
MVAACLRQLPSPIRISPAAGTLTPAQRERRRASQKRWEEKHREERRAWRDDHREQRIAYSKRWRAENRDHIKRKLRDRAQKESKPEAAE